MHMTKEKKKDNCEDVYIIIAIVIKKFNRIQLSI